jgi:hypothetical protein
MKKINLNSELFEILLRKLSTTRSFVQEALDLTEVPELDVVSEASTIEEAMREQAEVEYCCNEEERAAFRRWIELAAGNEKEILLVFERIGDCDDAEPEKMLAIRAMAETLLDKK